MYSFSVSVECVDQVLDLHQDKFFGVAKCLPKICVLHSKASPYLALPLRLANLEVDNQKTTCLQRKTVFQRPIVHFHVVCSSECISPKHPLGPLIHVQLVKIPHEPPQSIKDSNR